MSLPSGTLPGVVQCGGPVGCGQLLDLGVSEERRGVRLVEHLRDDPAHAGEPLGLLLTQIVLHVI